MAPHTYKHSSSVTSKEDPGPYAGTISAEEFMKEVRAIQGSNDPDIVSWRKSLSEYLDQDSHE